jgi:hypothetical protein
MSSSYVVVLSIGLSGMLIPSRSQTDVEDGDLGRHSCNKAVLNVEQTMFFNKIRPGHRVR